MFFLYQKKCTELGFGLQTQRSKEKNVLFTIACNIFLQFHNNKANKAGKALPDYTP